MTTHSIPVFWTRIPAFIIVVGLGMGLSGCTGLPQQAVTLDALTQWGGPAAAASGSALLLSHSSLGVGSTAAAEGGGAAAAGGTSAAASVTGYGAFIRPLGGAALLAYALYDPLAPNWTVEVQALNERTFRIVMTQRALTTGGNGESWRIFQRAARTLAQRHEAADYEIRSYEEGVHSTRPLAHRYAIGEVRLSRP